MEIKRTWASLIWVSVSLLWKRIEYDKMPYVAHLLRAERMWTGLIENGSGCGDIYRIKKY